MDVFQYSDYRNLLKDFYSEQKAKSAMYSYKVFANKAKLGSPNYLKLVIEGSRRITDKSLPNFVRGLKLGLREAEYFKALVAFQEASDAEARRSFETELRRIRDRNTRTAKMIEEDQLEVLKSWRHFAICEMTLLDDFSSDPKWIAARLGKNVTAQEAHDSLQLLLRVGMLKIENGKYIQAQPLSTTSDEVFSQALREHHKQSLEVAIQSVLNDETHLRETNSLILAVSEERLQDIKKAIKEFRKEINRIYSRDTGNTDVYQLTINFFPLTRQGGKL